MTDISATMHKIPPIGYAVAIGGGLLLYMYTRNKPAASAPVDLSGGTGTGAGTSMFIGAPAPSAPSGPVDMESWGIAALAYLIGAGYPPFDASQAIRKFLDGQNISSREKAMIDAAIKGIPLPTTASIPVGGGVIPDIVVPPTPPVVPVVRKPIFVPGGAHLSWVISYYGVSEATLRALNSNISNQLTKANKNGFISPSNPDRGDAVPVFGANTWLWTTSP
jgi:hypothetical protein